MNNSHLRQCYSGTKPWNRCFCRKTKEKVYKCECGKYQGRKHGLETHKRMQHKL